MPSSLCGVDSAHKGDLGYSLLNYTWLRWLQERIQYFSQVFWASVVRFEIESAEMRKTHLSERKSKAYRYVNYVLDFGPVVVTVLVATLATLASARSGIATNEMLQWILIILALLATTQLLDRFRVMRDIDGKLERLIDRSQGVSGATSFFVERIPYLEERFHKARSIAINGMTLSTTSDKFWGTFKQRIEDGAEIRLVIIDPEHPALSVAANRFHKHQDPQRVKREIEHTLDNLESLMAKTGSRGSFQVRLLPYIPSYGIQLIDANSPQAEIWVELYTFRDEPEPSFHLIPSRDGAWFSFFQKQFETMWNASRDWRPSPGSETYASNSKYDFLAKGVVW